MILTDKRILEEIDRRTIVIEPYNRECLGTNSYDIHLSKHMAVYGDIPEKIIDIILSKERLTPYLIQETKKVFEATVQLDAKENNSITRFIVPESGITMIPEILFLGSTLEYTETHTHVPFLEGKSSMGRLGVDIHATAGKGDVGFCNHWTLELSCIHPVRLYPGMPVGQMIYFVVDGDVETSYNKKSSAKYTERNEMPMPSGMWKNKF